MYSFRTQVGFQGIQGSFLPCRKVSTNLGKVPPRKLGRVSGISKVSKRFNKFPKNLNKFLLILNKIPQNSTKFSKNLIKIPALNHVLGIRQVVWECIEVLWALASNIGYRESGLQHRRSDIQDLGFSIKDRRIKARGSKTWAIQIWDLEVTKVE